MRPFPFPGKPQSARRFPPLCSVVGFAGESGGAKSTVGSIDTEPRRVAALLIRALEQVPKAFRYFNVDGFNHIRPIIYATRNVELDCSFESGVESFAIQTLGARFDRELTP